MADEARQAVEIMYIKWTGDSWRYRNSEILPIARNWRLGDADGVMLTSNYWDRFLFPRNLEWEMSIQTLPIDFPYFSHDTLRQ